jgi:CHAT domain-containing protein
MSIRMIPGLAPAVSQQTTPRTALISSGGALRSHDLPALPGAQIEVRAVEQAMRDAHIATRTADDAEAFITELRRADVVHFAGHAVVNEQYPLLSRLVLASSGEDAWITGERLASLGPIAPRLVFLSACSTQAGRAYGGEGPASLARSFMAAGAHEVVASLWPVADGSTPAIVSAFYRSWAEGHDAAQALRNAVLADLREGKSTPQQWAAWVVVGRRHARQGSSVNQPTGD